MVGNEGRDGRKKRGIAIRSGMADTAKNKRATWAVTGLGRVLIIESWVSGGAPMSAFGGRADSLACLAGCPLIAISGHWWLYRNLLFSITASETPGPV